MSHSNENIEKQMTENRFNDEIIPMHAAMYRVAVAILGTADDAADVVQDVMVKLWNKRHTLDSVSSLSGYAINAVRNECVTRMTRTSQCADIDSLADQCADDDQHAAIERRESLRIVARAIEGMPDTQRQVFDLSIFGALSNQEIANATGLTEVNVRAILSRGRKKLKQLFSKNDIL